MKRTVNLGEVGKRDINLDQARYLYSEGGKVWSVNPNKTLDLITQNSQLYGGVINLVVGFVTDLEGIEKLTMIDFPPKK